MIPDVAHLEGELLSSILRSAGVAREELEGHLAHIPKRSGFFMRAPSDAAAAPAKVAKVGPSSKRRKR